MPIRRRGKLLSGAIAAVAALTLTALPAGAANVALTSGSLVLRRANGTVLDTISLTNPFQCTNPTSTVTTTSGTTVSIVLRSHIVASVAGTPFIFNLTITLNGSYTGGPPSYALSGASGTLTATAIRSSAGTCTPVAGAGNCTITASNISWTGTLNTANIHALAVTDTGTLNGSNTAFNTVVTGTPANCVSTALVLLNNGSITLSALTLHIIP